MTKKILVLLAVLFISSAYLVDEEQTATFGSGSPVPIEGEYQIQMIEGVKVTKSYRVTLKRNSISIQACNSLQSKFSYNPSTKKWSVGQFSSTKKACPGSQDSAIIRAFKKAIKSYWKGKILVFEDGKSYQTISLRVGGSTSDGSSVLKGNYIIQSVRGIQKLFRRVTVTIKGNEISLKGCNNLWAKFEYNSGTKRWSVGNFLSTLIGCQNDQDGIISQALRNAITATRSSKLLTFSDKKGDLVTCKVISLGSSLNGQDQQTDQGQLFEQRLEDETQNQPLSQGEDYVDDTFSEESVDQGENDSDNYYDSEQDQVNQEDNIESQLQDLQDVQDYQDFQDIEDDQSDQRKNQENY